MRRPRRPRRRGCRWAGCACPSNQTPVGASSPTARCSGFYPPELGSGPEDSVERAGGRRPLPRVGDRQMPRGRPPHGHAAGAVGPRRHTNRTHVVLRRITDASGVRRGFGSGKSKSGRRRLVSPLRYQKRPFRFRPIRAVYKARFGIVRRLGAVAQKRSPCWFASLPALGGKQALLGRSLAVVSRLLRSCPYRLRSFLLAPWHGSPCCVLLPQHRPDRCRERRHRIHPEQRGGLRVIILPDRTVGPPRGPWPAPFPP